MEVEVKLRLDGDAARSLRRRLEGLGAGAHAPVEQTDTFFQHPCRDFVAGDEAFRLREVGGRRELTYKGPRVRGEMKARPEFNLDVGQDPRDLLAALGFLPAAVLRKRREAWHLEDVEVAIDHLDGVGWFAEIEAHDGDLGAAARVEAWRERLGLAGHASLQQSYLELALAAGGPAAELL